ncbi:MAG: transglycosylase SLT domain-containing protein [Burkholderiales bacterium]|nr:transglycosylase SLT domain-containing protein [Burkholderiales bacterium]
MKVITHPATQRHRLPLSLCLAALLLGAHPTAAASGGPAPQLKISYSLQAYAPSTAAERRPQDLWARVRSGFRLKEVNPELTRRHERWFAERPGQLQRAIERSRLYLYHIVDEVERRGMPMEVALLPLIESAFDPMAVSPRRAAGIWQFIPSTGRLFGLEQNAWYDGRRDVLAATRAALDYLQTLYDQFGRWELALAAYNCGDGCVARALRSNRARGLPTHYAALPLPAQTRHYVPKLLAVRNLILDPAAAGLELQRLDNEPYFAQVRISQPMPARQVARLADMSLDEFMALNPAYQRQVIRSDTPGVLLLPADRVDAFHLNLYRKGAAPPRLQPYAARRGESLQGIAERFGVTVEWLKEHNPVRAHKGRLTAAQTLYVPAPRSPHMAHKPVPAPLREG